MKTRYRLMMLLLMFAGSCAYFGTLESTLAQRSSSQPETISLKDLIVRGADENPNIVLSDFKIVDEFAVEKKRLTGKWTKVWVPIVPSDTTDDQLPTAIHAVIFSDQVESFEQVYDRFSRPQLRGLIDADTAEPSLSASLMWKQKFPDMDLRKCIVIVEGKQPATILKQIALWLGCAVFVAMAAGVWLLARKMDRKIGDTGVVEAEIVDPA